MRRPARTRNSRAAPVKAAGFEIALDVVEVDVGGPRLPLLRARLPSRDARDAPGLRAAVTLAPETAANLEQPHAILLDGAR